MHVPGFYFDETALVSSQEELLGQLPERIASFGEGIAFNDLFSALTNETPVTAEIMRGVLRDLAEEGVIQVVKKQARRQTQSCRGPAR